MSPPLEVCGQFWTSEGVLGVVGTLGSGAWVIRVGIGRCHVCGRECAGLLWVHFIIVVASAAGCFQVQFHLLFAFLPPPGTVHAVPWWTHVVLVVFHL